MNLAEAKQNAKDLNQTLTLLIAATEGIKDADFEALQKRKDALAAEVGAAQTRLKYASADAEGKIAQAKADTESQLADLKKQLSDALSTLNAVRTEARVSRETMREAIASEKAELLKDRQETLSRLDAQIAARQKALDEVNAAVNAARARFA